MGINIYKKDASLPEFQSNIDMVNNRKIINGKDDGLYQVSPIKHKFADDIFRLMLHNTWFPQEVPLQKDVETWYSDELTKQEKIAYERSLAFVSNLDGLQTNNLINNVVRQITSPEVSMVLVRQAYEEALHVHSYATMIETLRLDPDYIYGMYRNDKKLYNKNKEVLRSVAIIANPAFKTGTFKNDQLFLEACFSNIILEGLYFYSAFLLFYTLKRNNKMPGSAEMIQFINRDEDIHLRIFTNIVNTIKEEQPELWNAKLKGRFVKNMCEAVEMEYNWGIHCIGDGILNLTPKGLRDYLQFVADTRLRSVGLPNLYNSKNPYSWIDSFTQGSMTETNFFEGTVREYRTGSLEW